MLLLETTYFNRSEYNTSASVDIYPGKLRIATATHIYYLDIKDIVRIQSVSNYSKLFFSSGQTLIVSKVLAWFDELLHTRYFFRVHRTHLINLLYLKQYVAGHTALAAMSNNEEIPVARRKKKDLREKMMVLSLKKELSN
jgi:two-component system, LytTR family, response regulator